MENVPGKVVESDVTGKPGESDVAGQLEKRMSSLVSDDGLRAKYKSLHWEGDFKAYLRIIEQNPGVLRNAYQRLRDMILSYGVEEFKEDGSKELRRFKFFQDPFSDGKDAIFGLEENLMELVGQIDSAAHGYGTERRILLLHGPVGSSKSTITRLMKKGLEAYSHTDAGTLYTFSWQDDEDENTWNECPMHQDPLTVLPPEIRNPLLEDINARAKQADLPYELQIEGDLCPPCRRYFTVYMSKYEGDINEVLKHIRVRRMVFSEKDRVGIGTFQPKDEKNQDSTELTGDINYRKIAMYGSDSDPRAFNFDGEFNVANRGLIEFVEVLKLDVAFLYELLGASQEHVVKPKKFAQTDIDEVIIGHTNGPEFKRLKNNELMEAFRDRTLKINIPYNLKLDHELSIYQRDYGSRRGGNHIAPHTLEVAAMWAVLTRLRAPKKAKLTLIQKLKLYNGKTLPGYTPDSLKELRAEHEQEGMEGISPRYIQDKLSNALVKVGEAGKGGCVNPFMVINELDEGLDDHSLVTDDDDKKHYRELIGIAKAEYEDIAKNEVQRAISADEKAISRLFGNYIDHVKAYNSRKKIQNKFTGQDEEPDERLMRSIEGQIDIPDSRKDDFRRELLSSIGELAIEGKKFDHRSNERLLKALELKLFEDQKDTIKLSSLVGGVIDKDTQEKIDVVKGRLTKQYGYCDTCATDVLSFVASIFARGASKESD